MLSLKYVDRRLVFLALAALLLELWALVSDVHFLWRPAKHSLNARQVAQVQSLSGLARTRSPLQLTWSTLSAAQELYEGDEVATVGESSVSLHFQDGQRITLGPNSLLVLRKSLTGTSGGLTLSLLQGSLSKEKQKAEGNLEIEVGDRRVISTGETRFVIQTTGNEAPKIDVSAGRLQGSDLAPTRVVLPPTLGFLPPLLRRPRDGAVFDVALPAEQLVSLRWEEPDAGAGGQTLIEISRDPAFGSIEISRTFTAGEPRGFDFRPEHKGRYYWRVIRGTSGSRGQPVTSERGHFDITRTLVRPELTRPHILRGRSQEHLDAPKLDRPVIRYHDSERGAALFRKLLELFWIPEARADEMPAAASGPSGPSRYTAELEWKSVSGASAYLVQIAADSDFAHLIVETRVDRPSYDWGTNQPGFYYWRVAAIDSDQDHGPFSEFNTFTIRAERNKEGDEATYDTFQRFDAYTRHPNMIRLFYGPSFTNYYFSSTDPNSPDSVVYRKKTLRNSALAYDYRINPYFSIGATLREENTRLDASDYENRPLQNPENQRETIVLIAAERRFFETRHYYSLRLGMRASFLNLPVQDDNEQLTFDTFGFFGPDVRVGYHHLFDLKYLTSGAIYLGGAAQYNGDSYRLSQYAAADAHLKLGEFWGMGLVFEENVAAYRFSADNLTGQGHSLSFRPMIYIDFSY